MSTTTGGAAAADPENTLYLELESGRVVIELRPDLAPQHVARGRSDERRRSLIARSQVSPLVYQSRTGRFYSAGTEAFSGWVWCSG